MANFYIWGFEKNHSLENVLNLLKLDYKKGISFAEEHKLENSWKQYYEKELKIYDYNIATNVSIKYIPTIAHYEESLSESQSRWGENLKIEKTNHDKPVIFFEYDGTVYCIIFGTSSSLLKIRSALMGANNPKNSKSDKWGKLKLASPGVFNFSHDFFQWVYNKKNKEIETSNGKLKLTDITKLKQKDSSDESLSHEANGDQIYKDLVTKSSIAVGKKIDEIGLNLSHSDFYFRINFSSQGSGEFFKSDSLLKKPINHQITDKDLHKVSILLTIYCLQGLKAEYAKDLESQAWTPITSQNICKKEALYVVKALIKKHDFNEIDLFNLTSGI